MKNLNTSYKRSQGLSIIEMMISMVLGLFLVGGLSSIYLSTKESDKTRHAISEMEANARYAMESLSNGIQHAGYRSIYIIPFDKPFLSSSDGAPANTDCKGGGINNKILKTTLVPPFTVDGGDTNSDQITSIFLADNPDDAQNIISRRRVFTDCAGESITAACSADRKNGMFDPATAKIYNAYYIDENSKLMCIGSRTTGSIPTPIADNIENMQIRYGVIKNDQTRYKTAAQVEAVGGWQNVTNVQIALLISSSRDVLKSDETRTFKLLDQIISIDDDAKKRKLHRVYSTTINLANRNN